MNIHLPEKIKRLSQRMAQRKGENASEKDIKSVADHLLSMNHGPVSHVWSEVLEMWEAFKSSETPSYIKIYIIGALIYLVSPFDVIPDMFVGAGLLDDVFVLSLGYRMLKKAVPQVKECVGRGMQKISNETVEKLADKHIKPAFCHFLLWQWIKFISHIAVFIAAVLILKFSTPFSKSALCISSFLLFCVSAFFIVRAVISFSFVQQIYLEFRTARQKKQTRKNNSSDKYSNLKNIVAETLIVHLHLEKEESSASKVGNNFKDSIKNMQKYMSRFFIRAVASSKIVNDVNKKELAKIVFETLRPQIISFVICQFVYFGIFMVVIRSSVLVPLTGMSGGKFLLYFLHCFY